MSVPAYQLLAFATLNNYVTIGNNNIGTVIQVDVPASSANAIDVEITDIDLVPSATGQSSTTKAILNISLTGFGAPSNTVPNANIGHTADAGVVTVPSYGLYYGNVRWFMPNGVVVDGVTLSAGAGGNVSFNITNYSPTGAYLYVGCSYIVVWGVYSSVV